jgi:hypothetical protein
MICLPKFDWFNCLDDETVMFNKNAFPSTLTYVIYH